MALLSGLFGGNKAQKSTAPNRQQRKEEVRPCTVGSSGWPAGLQVQPTLTEIGAPSTNCCVCLQLLELIAPLKRGLTATEEDQQAIEGVVQQLEKINPNLKPLESPYLNGRWRLVRGNMDRVLVHADRLGPDNLGSRCEHPIVCDRERYCCCRFTLQVKASWAQNGFHFSGHQGPSISCWVSEQAGAETG